MSSKKLNNEENEIEKRRIAVTGFNKPSSVKEYFPKELKRAALGELGNRAITRASFKEKVAVKPTDYKHVKPRVDCHWKGKNDKEKYELTQLQTRIEAMKRIQPNKIVDEVKAKFEPPKIRITRPSDESKDHSQGANTKPSVATYKNVVPHQIRSHSQQLLSQIENIDEDDSNIFLVNEYAIDVYEYLFELENKNVIHEKYLKNHVEVTPTMRTILIDWLSETHNQFQLVIETYFLTIALVDIYLQKHPETKRRQLQLVGCTALFIAAKYEEVYAPDIGEFVYITDKTYTEKQICEMEKAILLAANFRLGQPLTIQFLRRFSKACNVEAVEHLMAKYFIELASIDYSTAHLNKSLIAAACLYLAIHLGKKEESFNPRLWTSTAEHYSHYSAKELHPVALQIIKLIHNAPKGPKNKYFAIYTKYSKPKNNEISRRLNEHKSKLLLNALEGHNC